MVTGCGVEVHDVGRRKPIMRRITIRIMRRKHTFDTPLRAVGRYFFRF